MNSRSIPAALPLEESQDVIRPDASIAQPASPRPFLVTTALCGIVLLALALRRWGWENWSFWLDECLQLFVAQHPTRHIIELLRNERNHPPLDYLLTHLALKVSASALVLRFVPTFFSLLALPLVFRRAGGMRRPFAALGSALALAVFPLAVHQGQELRAYALAFFFVAVADVARSRHDESGRTRALVIQALASIAAVYSLYIAFFPLAVGWALDALASRKPQGARAHRRLVVPIVTILAFLPWLLAVRSNLTRPNEMPAPPLTLRLAAEFATGLVADQQPRLRFAAAAVIVWSLVALGLVRAVRPERKRLTLELSAILLSSALFLRLTNHWFELRYFWFALWPLSQLVGEGLDALQRGVSRLQIPAFLAGAALLIGVEAPPLAENARSGRVDWRPPVQYLVYQNGAGRGGPVIPLDWWSYMCLSAQRMDGGPFFPLEEPALTPATLASALERSGQGWIARVTWSGSESGRLLSRSRPWATFKNADGLTLHRFEKGLLVPP